MQTIKYRFADGTTSEIEVTDEFYTLYAEPVQQEKRNHWKETRRHISLDYLNENGIDFESPAADPLSVLLRNEDEERIHKALSALSDKQKRLVQAVFYEGKSLREIARQAGISHQALSKQLATIARETRRQKLLCPRRTRKRAFRRCMVRQRGRRTYPNLYRIGR